MSSDSSPSLSFVRDEYDRLCRELNMDAETAEKAWKEYKEIRENYTLEVLHNYHANVAL